MQTPESLKKTEEHILGLHNFDNDCLAWYSGSDLLAYLYFFNLEFIIKWVGD